MATSATIEDERWMRLYQERRALEKQQSKVSVKKKEMSFGGKLKANKMLLVVALIFDVVGLIPYLGVVANFIFAAMVWIYFMVKTGSIKQRSAGEGIGGSIVVGSIADFILFGIVPANLIMVLNKLRVIKQFKKLEIKN